MARNKYPEITRFNILESAVRLFTINGWDNVTIQDIVDDVGDITRGAFYHHFKSKADLIDAVTAEFFSENKSFENQQKSEDLTAIERLRKGLYFSLDNHVEHGKIIKIPHMINSPEFIFRMVNDGVHVIAPDILKLILQGNRDGSMKVTYPKQAAETFTLLLNLWTNPIIFPVSKEEYMQKIEHINLILSGIGIPFINDEVRATFEKYYDNIQDSSKK